MFERLLAPLLETLRPHFALSKSRLETLAVLLVGLANCRTVNLSHLASQFPGAAKHSSNYRRLQRFSQFVQLDGDVAARLIMRMLNLTCPALLALDRTNWKLGSRDVNILMLAVVTHRFRVPLMWVHCPMQGHRDRWLIVPMTGSAETTACVSCPTAPQSERRRKAPKEHLEHLIRNPGHTDSLR